MAVQFIIYYLYTGHIRIKFITEGYGTCQGTDIASNAFIIVNSYYIIHFPYTPPAFLLALSYSEIGCFHNNGNNLSTFYKILLNNIINTLFSYSAFFTG